MMMNDNTGVVIDTHTHVLFVFWCWYSAKSNIIKKFYVFKYFRSYNFFSIKKVV